MQVLYIFISLAVFNYLSDLVNWITLIHNINTLAPLHIFLIDKLLLFLYIQNGAIKLQVGLDRIRDGSATLRLVLLSQTAADLRQVNNARPILSLNLLHSCTIIRLIAHINEQLQIIIILNLNILIVIIIIIIDLCIWQVYLIVFGCLQAQAVNIWHLLTAILATLVINIDDATLCSQLRLLVLVDLLISKLGWIYDLLLIM